MAKTPRNQEISLFSTRQVSGNPAAHGGGPDPHSAAILEKLSEFKVVAAGEPIDRANILYAGAAPGFAGLYQINLRLPGNLARNPELQIGFNNMLVRPESLAVGSRQPVDSAARLHWF